MTDELKLDKGALEKADEAFEQAAREWHFEQIGAEFVVNYVADRVEDFIGSEESQVFHRFASRQQALRFRRAKVLEAAITAYLATLPNTGTVGTDWTDDDKVAFAMLGHHILSQNSGAETGFSSDHARLVLAALNKLQATLSQPSADVGGEAVAWITPETLSDLLNNRPWAAGAIGEFSQRQKDEYTVPLYAAPASGRDEGLEEAAKVLLVEYHEAKAWKRAEHHPELNTFADGVEEGLSKAIIAVRNLKGSTP